MRNQHPFVQRTFVNRSNVSVRVRYSPLVWGGRPYYAYHHDWAFHPRFWSGVYFGWRPWHWRWAFFGAPWFVTWGWYWAPYDGPYEGPDYWLTDWVVSDMLADSYERGRAEGRAEASTPSGAPITRQEKEQLREQVAETARSFQEERTLDLREVLAQHPDYLFPANQTLQVLPASGGAPCRVTEGDLLQVVRPPTERDPSATLKVISSKFGNCAAGAQVMVSVPDLQEMLNSLAERVDRGLHELEQRRGAQGEDAPPSAAPGPMAP